jgi:Ran GTPase-activating protein (RanGAP) involved in mRNA processing and transport
VRAHCLLSFIVVFLVLVLVDSGAAALAEALKVNLGLQKLNLVGNDIGDSGAAAIARALFQHSTLQQLDLRDNRICDAGVAAFEQSLERSFLGLEQNLNVRFPKVLHEGKI